MVIITIRKIIMLCWCFQQYDYDHDCDDYCGDYDDLSDHSDNYDGFDKFDDSCDALFPLSQ